MYALDCGRQHESANKYIQFIEKHIIKKKKKKKKENE
jgi:hypothetical protein